jgi:carboxymethylenebutenolidase
MTDETAPQNVTFPSNSHHAHGYLALPPGGQGPGLIVIQEWWGITEHMVDITERFADAGFLALAPDLFGGRTTHDGAEAARLATELPVEQAARDLAGAVDFLLAHEAVTSERVGAVGFCMGGGFVLMLAAQQGDRIAAAVPFYGVGPGVPDQYRTVTADIQGHYAERDGMYPVDQARAQEAQIRAESAGSVEFFYYPAGHAFLNDTNLIGTYDPASAQVAWQRAVEFLHGKLG